MTKISVIQGDITQQDVDVIVNAANNRMRGGGGVDGAIHCAGGPDILRECIEHFPHGLATGDAGWTTAGNMPALYVVHTVGPNYNAGQTDRALLTSAYARSLEVADSLNAETIAFPLISAGVYGWPKQDAIDAAIETILNAYTDVEEVRLVAFDQETYQQITQTLARQLEH